MAIGGPEPTPLDLIGQRMPSAPPSVTGPTDAQRGQEYADYAASLDPNQGLPGMMSQDRVPVQQAMNEPLAPEQQALSQAERTISAREFLGGGGGGRGFRDAAYYPTQDELYPEQRNILIGHTGGVGKYGRSPIFYGGNNILPLSVVGGKMKAIADERKELEKAAKGLDLTAGLEKLANPNYEAVRNQWVRDNISSSYAKWRDFYGGDDIALRAAINTPGSAANKDFFGPGGVIDSVNTISKQANQIFAETENVIKAMTEGDAEMDEELLNKAYEVREGIEYGGDIRKLAKDWRSLQAIMNVDKFIKENGLMEVYEKIVKESTQTTGPVSIRVPGGRVVKFDKTTSSEDARKQLAKAVAENPIFRGMVDEEYVLNKFPEYEKTEVAWKLMQDRAPKGSKSSGSQGAAPKYSIIASAEPQFNTSDVWSGKPKQAVPTLTVSEDVGGKNRPLGTLVFEDQNQVPIRVAGARLQKRGNEWATVGMEIDNRYIDTYQTMLERFDGDEEAVAKEMSRLNMAKPIEIPYKMHAARWKGYFNDPNFDPDSAYQQQAQQGAPAKTRQGNVTVRMPDGKTGSIPASQVAAFRKKYPNAQVVE